MWENEYPTAETHAVLLDLKFCSDGQSYVNSHSLLTGDRNNPLDVTLPQRVFGEHRRNSHALQSFFDEIGALKQDFLLPAKQPLALPINSYLFGFTIY